ncbi:hypothetical protein JavanS728_0024 [Streptococcus satellite phage Javan728]|nr:hypothetical protein JavanS728_0024 [Streptococcus satellite phage Javan728]
MRIPTPSINTRLPQCREFYRGLEKVRFCLGSGSKYAWKMAGLCVLNSERTPRKWLYLLIIYQADKSNKNPP